MQQCAFRIISNYQEVQETQEQPVAPQVLLPPSMPISVISTEDNNNFTNIELPPTDTDVSHLQEQFSPSVCDPSSQDDSVQAFPEQNEIPEEEFIRPIPPGANIGVSLATAGLMFGATAASATSRDESHMDVWATTLSGRRDGRDFSTSNSALVSILGREKYMQASRMTAHARTVPPSERCFFVLLLLVTLIYAIGILTALVLLCFHMWFLKH